ncbi:MAG: hypothetical protein RR178_06700, partial [Gordonibacter sp.]
ALLVFMVAAPVIVGVYDANKGSGSAGGLGTGATGSISYDAGGAYGNGDPVSGEGLYRDVLREDENRETFDVRTEANEGNVYSAVSNGGFAENGRDSTRSMQGDTSQGDDGSEQSQNKNLIDRWYDCDPTVSDIFASDGARLTYSFPDGATIDFGNPYELFWDEESLPADYYEVIAAHEQAQSSIFAPDKAYAGPGTWMWNKLKMLVAKSKYWESAPAAFYSLCITACMSVGMSPVAAQQVIDKFVQRIPPIVQMFTKEGSVATEETGLMVIMDATLVASRTGQSPAQIPALINQSATSVMNTGTLLSGSSANFMNAWYQILATNQVSASFLASNADFFTTLFSFLGAELTSYHDIPSSGATSSSGTLSYNGIDYEILFESVTDMLSGKPVVGSYASWTPIIAIDRRPDSPNGNNGYYSYESISQLTQSTITLGKKSLLMYKYGGSTRYGYAFDGTGSWVTDRSSETSFKTSFYSFETTWVTINPDVPWQVYSGENLIGSFVNGVYSGDAGSWKPDQPSSTNPYNGQVIGADAEFDANGNLVNAGNVNVSDITAPGYVQPNTYQDALDQMHAAATDNIPAKPDSPAFGNNGTLGDWVNQNKPQPPAPGKESSQDDFKVQDLEKVFPFSIPWDLYYLLAIFAAEPVAPNFNWRFDFAMVGEHDFAVDLAPFDPVAQVCRACETVLFCIGLALITRNLIRG